MPRFGVCTSVGRSFELKNAGWDYVEENVQGLFKGNEPDENYDGAKRVAAAGLPVYAANCLVPGDLKITGPAVNAEALKKYMTNVLRRAGQAGCTKLVFGSGGARQVPAGWDRDRAVEQIVEFGKMAAPIAAENGVTITLEHLNRKECNIVNTLTEELAIIRSVNHPNFQALFDTYHYWADDQKMDTLVPILPYIRHVHLADREGRVPPGQSGQSDYLPVFGALKKAGYDGGLSVEASGFDLPKHAAPVLKFLKEQWAKA